MIDPIEMLQRYIINGDKIIIQVLKDLCLD